MKQHTMRKAFSMITAIFVIVIMATIAAFIMNLSGKTVKTTSAQYRESQAELYAKSYTEYSVLAIQGHDRTANCVEQINGQIGGTLNNGGYRVSAYIAYISSAGVIGSCSNIRQLSTTVTTTSTPLTALIDVYVTYKDMDNPSAPVFTVHRRTVQKI